MKKIFIIMSCLFAVTLGAGEQDQVQLIVCEHSLEMFAHELEFVRHANESIEIASPFFGGKIMRQMIHAIAERMEEKTGLQVHILAAPLFLEECDENLLQMMRERYPERFHIMMSTEVPTLSPDMTAIHNHVKVFLVDEYYFAVGGTNLDEGLCTDGSYTPPRKTKDRIGMIKLPAGARDGDVVGRGGVLAQELRKAFFQLYALWEEYDETKHLRSDPHDFAECSRYFPVCVEKPYVTYFEESEKCIAVDQIKMVFSGPWEQPENGCTAEYCRLLKSAQKRVVIGNLYFSPVESLFSVLKDTVNRGVELTLLVNGIYEGVTPEYNSNFCWANRIHYVPLFFGRAFHLWEGRVAAESELKNCRIYEYYVPDVVYHKKAMVVDDRVFVVGSYNLGKKSDIADYELILVIESEEVVREALAIFEREKELSIEVTPSLACEWYFDPMISMRGGSQKLIHGIL